MLLGSIEAILTQRNAATNQHERDYSDICIEWMRTLPMEAAVGALFLTPEGETTYLNSISILLELASEFERNKATIGHICATIDAIPLAASLGHHGPIRICQILKKAEREQPCNSVHVSHIMTIYQKVKKTILEILAVIDPEHKKMLVSLFDRYIMSLAVVGRDKALSCHQPLTNLGRRNGSDTLSGYIIQSIASPDFSLRDFLLRGPISMFYGYIEPLQNEIVNIRYSFHMLTIHKPCISDHTHFRNNWARHQRVYGQKCMDVVRIIHGLKKEKSDAAQQFKRLYPNENLSIVKVLTRLA